MKRAKQRREPTPISDEDWARFVACLAKAGKQSARVVDDLNRLGQAFLNVDYWMQEYLFRARHGATPAHPPLAHR